MTQRHWIQNDATMLITTITQKRKPIFMNPVYAHEAIETLYRVQELHPFFLYAFVIMPDHCHFLVRIEPPETIAKIMNVYKSGMTFNTGIKKLWQRRYHIRITKKPYLARRYIHMNPVKAGYAEIAEDYPWSSAAFGKWDVSDLSFE